MLLIRQRRAAKAEVAALINRIGFVGIDLGPLAVGGKLSQFLGGPLPNQNLVKVGWRSKMPG